MLRRAGQNFYLVKERRVIPIPWTWPARPELCQKSVSQGKKVEKWWPQPQNATEQFPTSLKISSLHPRETPLSSSPRPTFLDRIRSHSLPFSFLCNVKSGQQGINHQKQRTLGTSFFKIYHFQSFSRSIWLGCQQIHKLQNYWHQVADV